MPVRRARRPDPRFPARPLPHSPAPGGLAPRVGISRGGGYQEPVRHAETRRDGSPGDPDSLPLATVRAIPGAAVSGPGVAVHLDSWLREFGPRGRETVEATSVSQLLDVLEGRYPRLRFKLRDETGRLRRYVRVFVDGEDVSGTTGLATPLGGGQTIDILHSIAGG